MEAALDEVELQQREFEDKEGVLLRFLDKALKEHKTHVETEVKDVFIYALDQYKRHLEEIEARDINALKR